MDKRLTDRSRLGILLVAAISFIVIILGVIFIGNGNSSGGDKRRQPSASPRVSSPLNIDQLKMQAKQASLPKLFIWRSPDADAEARTLLPSSSQKLRVGYLNSGSSDDVAKAKHDFTVFIINEVPKDNLDISQLRKTASDVVSIKGAKVLLPPAALISKGQLFVISDDHSLAGLISSVYTTRRQLETLAGQIEMIRS